ncbi:MAG: hypothetical protein ACLSX0_01020 [Anaerostipes caccae]|jgi:hypothetical protein
MSWFNGINEDGNLEVNAAHFDGLPNIEENTLMRIIVDEKERMVIFRKRLFRKEEKDQDILLSFDQILGAGFITRSKLVKKSVVGRAFVGSLFFGDTGTILGIMSGQGKKKKKELCFAISYSDSFGDNRLLLFDDTISHPKALPKRLNEIAKINHPAVERKEGPIRL